MAKRRLRAFSFCVLSIFIISSCCFAQPPKSASSPKYSPDTILVKPKQGISVARLATQHAALNARVDETFERIGNLQIVKLPRGLTVERAIERYTRSGLVEYAEPDYELYAVLNPNDPKFLDGTLYGMNKISAPAAWDTRTNANPIIVAVIDTGVRYTHEDLAANMWINPGEIAGNGIDDDGNGLIDDVYGAKFVGASVSGDPWDDHFHGTHCAGTVGGVGNNGIGIVGVAWRVRIMALKFLGSGGSGSTSDAIKCINYAIAKGAKIMSNSWGGGGADNALRDAIIAARNADIIFVAAAGNSSTNVDSTPFYPAGYDVDNIVSVAATDSNDLLASFSNFGLTTVDLGAPGVSVWSSDNSSDSGYRFASGTSMACPHVSGAAALTRAQFPGLTYSQIIARLLATTDPVASLAGKTVSGGRLNVHKALTQDPVADFTAVPTSGEPPLTVAFTDTSLGTITSRSLAFGDGNTTTTTTTAYTYNSVGNYNATLTVTGPSGTSSKTRQIVVAENYTVSPDTFSWQDTSGLTALSLTDDSYATQVLPFTFSFYGQNYTTLYIGSNGLFGPNTAGMTAYVNTDLPNSASPNNIICPYWDDLNPFVAGRVLAGSVGTAPNRIFVASWEGVPHYANSLVTYTFQALLFEGSNDIKIQWLEVQPGNLSLGAGRSATVGVENSSGTVARKYTYNGVPVLLSNNTAIRFTYGTTPPPPPTLGTLSVSPAGGLSSSGVVGGPFSPSSQMYTLSNTGGQAINWSAAKTANWVTLSSTGGLLAAGASTTVTVSINSNANSLSAGDYSDTVSFTNTTNGNGNTTRGVSLTVNPPPPGALSVSPTDGLSSSGFIGGPFSPSSLMYTLSNTGGQSINWTASKSANWVTLSSTGGSLAAGASTTVTVSINSNANSLTAGNYSDTVSFTNTTNGNGNTTRGVSLTVNAIGLNAPSGLNQSVIGPANARYVALSWIDNSIGEEGTSIERQTQASNGTWGSWVVVGTAGPNVTTYEDTSVVRKIRYRYRLRTYAAGGGLYSPYSQEIELRVP